MTAAMYAEMNDFMPWVAEAKRGDKRVYFVGCIGEAAETEITESIRVRNETGRYSRGVGPIESIRNYVAEMVEAKLLTVVHRTDEPTPKGKQVRSFEYIAVRL